MDKIFVMGLRQRGTSHTKFSLPFLMETSKTSLPKLPLKHENKVIIDSCFY